MFHDVLRQQRHQHVLDLSIITVKLLLCLVGQTHQQETPVEFGPSISVLTRANTINKSIRPVVHLNEFPNYATVLPLIENRTWGTATDIVFEKGSETSNSFTISVPQGLKIMAVIQELNLGNVEDHGIRHQSHEDEIKDSNTMHHDELNHEICSQSNFVKISDEYYPMQSNTVCGEVNFNDTDVKPKNLIGSRIFKSLSNTIEITFEFKDYNLPKYLWVDSKNEVYRLSISLTAFEECSDFVKSTKGLGYLVPCHPNPEKISPCISTHLLCNGVYNCAMEEPDLFSLDEQYCFKTVEEKKKIRYEIPKRRSTLMWIFKKDKWESIFPTDKPKLDVTQQFYGDSMEHFVISNSSTGGQYNYGDDQHSSSLSPPNAILAIMLLVVVVMILGSIVRFCCTKCVGTPPLLPTPPAEQIDDNFVNIFGLSNVQVINQCSRVDHTKDLPPSYDELFPQENKDEAAVIDIINGEDQSVELPNNSNNDNQTSQLTTVEVQSNNTKAPDVHSEETC